jgi:hypothetical protein
MGRHLDSKTIKASHNFKAATLFSMVSVKLFFTLCIAVLALASPARRTVADIEADIAVQTSDLAALADMVNAFQDTGESPNDALVAFRASSPCHSHSEGIFRRLVMLFSDYSMILTLQTRTRWFDLCPSCHRQDLTCLVQATGPLNAADGEYTLGLLNSASQDSWPAALEALSAKEPALAG